MFPLGDDTVETVEPMIDHFHHVDKLVFGFPKFVSADDAPHGVNGLMHINVVPFVKLLVVIDVGFFGFHVPNLGFQLSERVHI